MEIKEALQKKLDSLREEFLKNKQEAEILLKKRDALQASVDTLNKVLDGFVQKGSLIVAKTEALRDMIEE